MKLNLDLSNVELQREKAGHTLLPAGDYEAQLVGAEVKDTAKGGAMLVLTFEVVAGNMAGATFADRLNIRNASLEAERIALQSLKTIATFIGHPNPNKITDTDELMNKKPLKAHLEVREFTGTDGNSAKTNQVKYYSVVNREQAAVDKAASTLGVPSKPWLK